MSYKQTRYDYTVFINPGAKSYMQSQIFLTKSEGISGSMCSGSSYLS